jgi:large subunit ribosomal protein L20
MTRIKPSVTAHHRHKRTLAMAKGYSQGRRRLIRIANETVMKGLAYAYRDRRARKGDMRRLWIQRINAAARRHGMSYSGFMASLKARGITLNRKVLAELAARDIAAFDALLRGLEEVQAAGSTPS